MSRPDPHSYFDATQPAVDSLVLRLHVDFSRRVLSGEAELILARPGGGPLDLDTRDLTIDGIFNEVGVPLQWELAPAEPVLGARLRINLPDGCPRLVILYHTAPDASALQWLEPAQTAGGVEPYLFSQCQAIHARSVIPVQDTPSVRIRYQADLVIPRALRGLMAAGFVEREERGESAVERYEMPQPIPPYLFAFAVGRLESRELGPRSRVWAEPEVVDRAAWEFAAVDHMLTAGEALFGPYDWERFDILTMPPSFPYGGMENPRLTFLTPTLLAGDRSLVNVVAHELAHSWTGNLVTNCNAEHFWLNEGCTVFAERRILEALEGTEAAELHAALGRRALDKAIERFAEQPELTCLRTHLEGVDPDEAFSEIPYEKGYLFLRALEEAIGRPRFDYFLREYIHRHRFCSVSSDDFLRLLGELVPEALERVDVAAWLDGPGVPPAAPRAACTRIGFLEGLGGVVPEAAVAAQFSPTDWQLYLGAQPRPLPLATVEEIEAKFHLTASGNYEVLVAWLDVAAEAGFAPALDRVATVLGEVGRMKYLKPLFLTLVKRDPARARQAFEAKKGGYHPIARQVIGGVLQKFGA